MLCLGLCLLWLCYGLRMAEGGRQHGRMPVWRSGTCFRESDTAMLMRLVISSPTHQGLLFFSLPLLSLSLSLSTVSGIIIASNCTPVVVHGGDRQDAALENRGDVSALGLPPRVTCTAWHSPLPFTPAIFMSQKLFFSHY